MDKETNGMNRDEREELERDEVERMAVRNQQNARSYQMEEQDRERRDTEFSRELTADEWGEQFQSEEDGDVQTGFGWLAIILSAMSFFIMPLILGIAGIVFGFISRSRGADTLGNIAIAAGAIAVILSFFF